jgi:hypothetical protein
MMRVYPPVLVAKVFATALTTLLSCAAANYAIADDSDTAAPATHPAATKWASTPTDHWPLLLLKNQITIRKYLPWTGVTGFLMKLPSGQVVAVTTTHRLVQGIDYSNLKGSVALWVMHRPNGLGSRVQICAVAMPPDKPKQLNCAILTTIPMYGWPTEVLIPSDTPAEVGEIVFMADVADTDKQSTQHIFKGVVKALNHPSPGLIAFQIHADVDPKTFSGGPILDEQGHVVGIGQSWYPEPTRGSDIMVQGMQITTVMATVTLPPPRSAPVQSSDN